MSTTNLNQESRYQGQGVLLTRDQYDNNGRCTFEFWLQTEFGPHQILVEHQTAVCFIYTSLVPAFTERLQLQNIAVQIKPISLQSFDRHPCSAIYCDSLRDYFALRRLAKALDITLFEDDIKPVDRYLMERFIKGGVCFQGILGSDAGNNLHRVESCQLKRFDGKLRLPSSFVSVDIECDEQGRLYSIGLDFVGTCLQQRVLFNLAGVRNQPDINKSHQYIDWLPSEKAVLVEFVQCIRAWDPDFIIGWNFIKFDVRVLDKAAKRNSVKLAVGRDGSVLRFFDGQRELEQRYPDKCYVAGRLVLDGIEVLKNATYHFASFSLNSVAKQLLKEEKLITGATGVDKMQEITRQYQYEPENLAAYNLQDCKLVSKIFVQENLFEFLYTRSELTGLELDRVGGSVAAFTNLYLPKAHRAGWIAPNLVAENDYRHSPGGFVMDSKPGIHQDVLVFDFKSLYPSIIRTFNVDPVALVEADVKDDSETIAGFRGGRFARDKSILANILDELWQAREQAKAQNAPVLSNAIKIIMNSFYGVLGSAGCRFYDTKLASSITMRGHWVLEQSRAWFEQQGLDVIYGDTDSIFVCLDGSKWQAAQAKRLESQMNVWWQNKLQQEFQLESKLEMEYESHFAPFFMPTIRGTDAGSKKRYAGMKQHNHGTTELVMKGLESVRSDWTELAKAFQTKLLTLVFKREDCTSYVETILKALRAGELDEQLIYCKRIRQPLHAYVKTTPPQIKAARLANNVYGKELYRKGSRIEYIVGVQGPEEANGLSCPIDYEHYVEKQLLPIAKSILGNKSKLIELLFYPQQRLL